MLKSKAMKTIAASLAMSTTLVMAGGVSAQQAPVNGDGALTGPMPEILSMRERAEVRDQWLEQRLDTVVPMLMRRAGIDAWVLVAREYNEDPVVKTMLPARWLGARRTTVLMFLDHGPEKGVERLAVARYDVGKFFKASWSKEEQPDQWQRIVDILTEFDPEKVAINVSDDYALADGMTKSQYDSLTSRIPADMVGKIVSGEPLAVGWLETRTEAEMFLYPKIVKIAHDIIAEGFSSNVITAGETTAEDLVWWYRDRIRSLGLTTWFHPSVSIQRSNKAQKSFIEAFSKTHEQGVILKGDLLHVDFGINYLGLNSDTQQHAYMLRDDEVDAPQGLKNALAKGNRLQDILTSNFETGRTGNAILAASLRQANEEGLRPSIYTHPIGMHGHAAGTTIGMWDMQGGVPGTGDYPMYENTAYSIELNVTEYIPEWDQDIRIQLEEDGFFTGSDFYYIDGRQKNFHLISSK